MSGAPHACRHCFCSISSKHSTASAPVGFVPRSCYMVRRWMSDIWVAVGQPLWRILKWNIFVSMLMTFFFVEPPSDGSCYCCSTSWSSGVKSMAVSIPALTINIPRTHGRNHVVPTHAIVPPPLTPQELIAVADADGIIRTYRPLSRADDPGVVEEKQASQRDAEDGAASGAVPRSFGLVVECRLGARPALCDFASERIPAGIERSHRRLEGDGDGEEEVLRTCTREGNLRIWPTTSLPTHPIKPTPPQPPPAPDEAPARKTQTSRLDTESYGRPVTDTRNDQENRDPCEPFARWAAAEAKGRNDPEGGEAVGEEPIARGEAPLPGVRPAAPRRVSFAPAEQVVARTAAPAFLRETFEARPYISKQLQWKDFTKRTN